MQYKVRFFLISVRMKLSWKKYPKPGIMSRMPYKADNTHFRQTRYSHDKSFSCLFNRSPKTTALLKNAAIPDPTIITAKGPRKCSLMKDILKRFESKLSFYTFEFDKQQMYTNAISQNRIQFCQASRWSFRVNSLRTF